MVKNTFDSSRTLIILQNVFFSYRAAYIDTHAFPQHFLFINIHITKVKKKKKFKNHIWFK